MKQFIICCPRQHLHEIWRLSTEWGIVRSDDAFVELSTDSLELIQAAKEVMADF